jgi:hypothetical protein
MSHQVSSFLAKCIPNLTGWLCDKYFNHILEKVLSAFVLLCMQIFLFGNGSAMLLPGSRLLEQQVVQEESCRPNDNSWNRLIDIRKTTEVYPG